MRAVRASARRSPRILVTPSRREIVRSWRTGQCAPGTTEAAPDEPRLQMILLAAAWPGIVRAERNDAGAWAVERQLRDVPVTCIASTPQIPEVVWAGADDGATYRSIDRGRTWTHRSGSLGAGDIRIRSLAASPHDPDVAWVGTKPAGVFRTTDGGRSWREQEGFRAARRWYWASPAELPDRRAYVSALSVSPEDPDVVLAGVEAGAVVRSADGGRSWSGHRRSADRDCHALRFHATRGDWVYEAGGGGPAVSKDGGATWRHVTAGLKGRYAVACAADPVRPEVWYVSSSPYAVLPRFWRMPVAHVDGDAHASIYRSAGGSRWERLAGGLPQPLDHMAYGLATDPARTGHLWAALADGRVWHSEDFGDRWQQMPISMGGVRRGLCVA